MPLLNPKRAGKVAYHAGKIRMRHEFKKIVVLSSQVNKIFN